MTAGYWRYRNTEAGAQFRAARDLLLALRLDHHKACDQFRWPRPAKFNWALEWFDVVAAARPATPALELLDGAGGVRRHTFGELAARSDAVACWLRERGVRRGDRVLVVLGARVELWECLLACLKLGAVVVPTYPTLTGAEATDRVTRGRIRVVICDQARTGRFDGVAGDRIRVCVPGGVPGWLDYADGTAAPRPFVPDGPTPAADVAFGYFTSGTTARPKLVAHTHTSYPIGHLSSMYWNGLRPGDRHLNVSAPGWAKHSWSSFFVPWNAEATVVALPDGFSAPERLPILLADAAVDSFCAPPSVWQTVAAGLGNARPSLREATSAGEPLDPVLAARVAEAWGVTVRDGYGQTETTALIGTSPGMRPRPGWLGRPLPGYRVVVAPGGEVEVDLSDGPAGMMAGYLDDPERTRRAVGGERYRTGDVGECDPAGWIRISGRVDDVFKSAGHRVSPYEVEAVLRRHPGVAEVAVVARPDPVDGMVPHAVVVPHTGRVPDQALAAELLAYAKGELAPTLRPRTVDFVAALPRTRSGKVRRADLASDSHRKGVSA